MTAVVWAWCHFIDQQSTSRPNEKLDPQYSNVVECLGHTGGNVPGLLPQRVGNTGGNHARFENSVPMAIFGDREGGHVAVSAPRDNHRQLGFELDSLLQDTGNGPETFELSCR